MNTKTRENIVLTSFIVLTIFLFSISFVNAEINITTCPQNLSNLNNEIINIQNSLNYDTNQVCLNLTNVSNTIINGNYYNLNSTVTINAISTAIQLSDQINDTTGFYNITIQNLNFTGGVARPIYYDSYNAIDNLKLINLTWNGTGIVSNTYFINGATTKPPIMYNLYVENVWAQAYNKSTAVIQGFFSCATFVISGSILTNITYNKINISFVNPLPCSSGRSGNDNYFIYNSDITSFGTSTMIITAFYNFKLINSTITFTSFTPEIRALGSITLRHIDNATRNVTLENNILNNVTITTSGTQPSLTNMFSLVCMNNNKFDLELFNTSGSIKETTSSYHINRTCSENNTGWLPPSYIVPTFYDYIGNNITLLRYQPTFFPEFVYNFQLYNGSLGGWEYNSSGLFFNENLTYFANNNYTRAGACVESWYAILGDCINNQQLLTYVDVNMCGTNYSLPSNDNTYLNCTTSGGSNINSNVEVWISVVTFLLIVVIVASVIFVLYDNIKRRK